MKISLRTRLTVWYCALLAVSLIVFSVTIYLFLGDSLMGNLDTSLHQRLNQATSSVIVTNGQVSLPSSGDQVDPPFIPAALVSPRHHLLSGQLPPVLTGWLKTRVSSLTASYSIRSVGDIRLATAPVSDNGRAVGTVLVWQSMSAVNADRRSLLVILLLLVPTLILTAAAGGLLLASRALSPVAAVTRAASSISASSLEKRVEVSGTQDELSELAATFNGMLDRLEWAVGRERRFTADASHELRSPLAVIRAEATLALEGLRTSSDYRQALQRIDEGAGEIEQLVAALLMLARVEAAPIHTDGSFSVQDLIDSAIGQSRAAAQSRRVQLVPEIARDFEIEGSSTLLARALGNVVDNAIRVTPDRGEVHVSARLEGTLAVLSVQDQGPGIEGVHQAHLFEPFYRIESAHTPGDSHGLGLAICQAIVRAHGGTVSVISSLGRGTRFDIRFPCSPSVINSSPTSAGPAPSARKESVSTSSVHLPRPE